MGSELLAPKWLTKAVHLKTTNLVTSNTHWGAANHYNDSWLSEKILIEKYSISITLPINNILITLPINNILKISYKALLN